MLSMLKIIFITLMRICFFLKTDMKIGFFPVFIFEVQYHPFYTIPNEKRNIKKFSLLSCMN